MTKIYPLVLASTSVEVSSVTDIDETTATVCAQDALPWLQSVPEISSKGHRSYSLTCLLCQTPDALGYSASSLTTVQEHLMECHGFTLDDHARAIRVRCADDESLYVWTLPPDRATALQLPHLSYMRAVKHFARGVELNLESGDLEVYLSVAVLLGTHFDTISGVLKVNEQSWYPVMVCGKSTPEGFHPHKVVVLTDDPCGRDEASTIAWRSHFLFHTTEAQKASGGSCQ